MSELDAAMTETACAAETAPGLIEIAGPDAGEFLRAQLTNDVLRLGADRHLLSAWCDAKGRTVLIAHVIATYDGFLLMLPRSLIEAVLRRLRMYVLRAKVELADASDRFRIDGMIGPDLPPAHAVVEDGPRRLLGLPCASQEVARALCLSPAPADAPADTIAPDDGRWELGDIDAGLPTIYPATQGLFVPQMLNLHWLDGVDFDKGCYPGQEVIARLHYRGRLTRRLFRLAWSGDSPAPGDAVQANGERVGTVVRCAPAEAEAGRLLAVLKIDAATRSLATDRATLSMLDLPYPTPA